MVASLHFSSIGVAAVLLLRAGVQNPSLGERDSLTQHGEIANMIGGDQDKGRIEIRFVPPSIRDVPRRSHERHHPACQISSRWKAP
jgi:hypothetical protein